MPQKSRERRVKLAKRAGKTPVVKETDEGRDAGSAHAAKKPRHVAGLAAVRDRQVSPKAPPGEGRRTAPGTSEAARELRVRGRAAEREREEVPAVVAPRRKTPERRSPSGKRRGQG